MVVIAIVVLDASRVWWNALRPGDLMPDATPIPVDSGPQPAEGGAAMRAVRGFVRGFAGLVPLRGESSSVRSAPSKRLVKQSGLDPLRMIVPPSVFRRAAAGPNIAGVALHHPKLFQVQTNLQFMAPHPALAR